MALLKTNISYPGKEVDLILSAAFQENHMLTKTGFRLLEGVKGKMTFWDISSAAVLRAYTVCNTNNIEDVTLNQRFEELCALEMKFKFAHNALVGTARELMTKQGINAERGIIDDSALFAAIVDMVIRMVNEQLNDLLLNGDTTYGTSYRALCDGLLRKLLLDGTVVDVVGTTLDATNIFAELNKAWNAYPSKLKYRNSPETGPRFYVSTAAADFMQQAATQTANLNGGTYSPADPFPLRYLGVPVVPIHGMPASDVIVTAPDNVAIFTDREQDFNELVITDQNLSDAFCEEIHGKLKFRSGIMYNKGAEIVYYT